MAAVFIPLRVAFGRFTLPAALCRELWLDVLGREAGQRDVFLGRVRA